VYCYENTENGNTLDVYYTAGDYVTLAHGEYAFFVYDGSVWIAFPGASGSSGGDGFAITADSSFPESPAGQALHWHTGLEALFLYNGSVWIQTGGAPVGPATPTQPPNLLDSCELWLPASYITGLTSGDPVGTWADQSGNDRDAVQANSNLKPLYRYVSGTAYVEFDGSDDTMDVDMPSMSAWSVVLRVKWTVTGDKPIVQLWPDSGGGTVNGGIIGVADFGNYFGWWNSAANTFTHLDDVVDVRSDWHTIYITFSASSGATVKYYLDGVLTETLTNKSCFYEEAFTLRLARGNGYSDAQFRDIALYSRVLSESDIATLNDYFGVG
jgi:hypothetical protein